MYSRCARAGISLGKKILHLPAVRALLAQVVAFAVVLVLAYVLPELVGWQISIAAAALIQGAIAALLVWSLRLAPWWILIQFVFPIALLTSAAVQLPSAIYLAAFLVLLCVYWTTFRTQVPYYPSSSVVWQAVSELLPKGKRLRVIDIGSGFGGLVMYLAKWHPESEVIGIELAPLPWICSRVRAELKKSAGRFVRGDYEALDFAEYDVVFAYLSPAAMPRLWRKVSAEMRSGTLLLSHEFTVPGVEPDIVVQPPAVSPAIFGWHIK